MKVIKQYLNLVQIVLIVQNIEKSYKVKLKGNEKTFLEKI